MHDPDPLAPLFSPRSVAIVGVSRHAEKLGHVLLSNLLAGGFAGTIHGVNRHGGAILGLPMATELAACPRGLDLVILAVPSAQVVAQARLALARGCAALVVVSDGFGDRDEAGVAQEAALAKLCRERGVLLLGPNSLGLVHRQQGMNASPVRVVPPAGGISLFSQSAAVCMAAMAWMASRQLGVAKMIGLGNQAGVTAAQCMSHLAHDPDTQVIACYLEWMTEGGAFLKAATEASHHKPVVMLLGRGTVCYLRPMVRQAGCLMHSSAVFAAVCDRSGIILSADFQGWLDAIMALARAPQPAGNRVAILSNGVGPGVLSADSLDQYGLSAVPPNESPPAHQQDDAMDPGRVVQAEQYQTAVDAAMQAAHVDAVMVVVAPHFLTCPATVVQALPSATERRKPLLAVLMGGAEMQPGVAAMDRLDLPAYPTPERAAAALATLDQYGRWRRRPPRVVPRFSVNQSRVRRLIQRCGVLALKQIADLEAKQILQAYGIALPEGERAGTVQEAVEVAERTGYPIALHLLSPDLHLVHDMEIRHVNVAGPQAVRDGFDLLTLRFANRMPEGRLEGVFVEKIPSHGRPVLIGMKRDRQFGPLLHVGSATPLSLEDASCQLAPITNEEALIMVRGGLFQRPTQDAEEDPNDHEWQLVAEVLQRISQLAIDFPEISRIQINPLLVRRAGLPPVAIECEILLEQQGSLP
ncbi:MAG: acetate--CoA ligase family protein [Magnetococcus sp. MYC-9]